MITRKVILDTGDEELNKLLAADEKEKGLCVGRAVHKDAKDQFIETSVVVVEGGAGTGKTVLALQVACAIAKNAGEKWSVVFISLEQHPDSLRNVADSFHFGGETKEERDEFFPAFAALAPCPANKVLFCRLSPLPLSEHKPEATFETRFSELQHIVLKQSGVADSSPIFVIDSLNAFTGHPLTRSQLYQLFTLFQTQHIPLVVTLEQPETMYSGGASEIETACFLADIVIKLKRDLGSGYLQFFLEVSKSRVCRQGLGKHLYKTRTIQNAEDVGASDRKGLVVYPSMHFIISQARVGSGMSQRKKTFRIAKELHDRRLLDLESPIKSPACFALQGPAGTHKLALGLNLGISYVRGSPEPRSKLKSKLKAKLLVVTFGGQGEIDFPGVAWLESQRYLSSLSTKAPKRKQRPEEPSEVRGTKAEKKIYYANNFRTRKKSEAAKEAEVTVLTFKIGVLTPEECIYRIKKVLDEQEDKNPFHSVLISDTAELCTGFPLLSKDPMFFAALLDLFESRSLLTVGIGVHSTDSPNLREINLALMAKATHRMVFSQHPTVEKLMEEMVNSKRLEKRLKAMEQNRLPGRVPIGLPTPLDEQLVSVVIDNVTGKHYKREPRWIRVDDTNKPKLLECLPFKAPNIYPKQAEEKPALTE
jgi:KaiC/GvpD/RAD55 family RecA-like ATPase